MAVEALLHFDGADGSTTFTDETGRTWTAVGSAQLDTAQSKWGTSSLLLDGNGDAISTVDAAALEPGAGQFSLECWVRFAALPTSGNYMVFFAKDQSASGNLSFNFYLINSGGTLRLEFAGSTDGSTYGIIVNRNWTPSLNTWYFVQFIRDGATSKFAVDGVQVGADVSVVGTLANVTAALRIGSDARVSTNCINGWIDDARYTVGVAQPIVLPTGPFAYNFLGNSATGAVGNLVASVSVALTGNAATGSVGTFGFAQSLSGNAGVGSVGSFLALSEIEQEWVWAEADFIEQEWVWISTFLEFIEQEWVWTSDIRTFIEQEWIFDSPILNTEMLEVELIIVSPILGAAVTVVTASPTVTIRGNVVPLESATVSCDDGQFAWTCQLTLTDPRHYNLFRPEDEFTVNLPGEDYAFIVDNVGLSRSSQVNLSATVAGIGPSALYATPRASKVTRTWDEAVLATAVVEELFGVGVVEWEILDWSIPAFRLGVQDQAPMEVLQKLATAAGATVRPDPDGTIRVQYLYPVSVPQYETATPDEEYFDAPHNFEANARSSYRQLVDKLRILDVEPGAGRDTIEFEQDKADFTKGTLKVFPSPWRTDVTVEHTSDSRVSASLVGEETEELTETVEVLGGKGSVSKPIYEVVSLEWLYVDLTGIAFEVDSTSFTTTHPTLKESLLSITYRTRFIEFEASAFADAEVQFLVREAA